MNPRETTSSMFETSVWALYKMGYGRQAVNWVFVA